MKSQGWEKRMGWRKHTALLLAVLMLMSTIPVFTYAEDIVGGASEEGSAPASEAAPAEESKPDGEQPPESGSASGESPSEERRHNEDDKGSTDEYSLTATQEEVFTEDGLAVEITAVSTFPFTRNLHIEAKDGGKAEGATEGAEKVTGDPEAASSEASGPEENGSEASSVPEESTSSEAASSEASSVPEVSSAPEESASSEESKPEETPESGKPEENGKPGGAEDSSNPISELAEAAASARINLVRVLSAEITAEEIVPLPESGVSEPKPESSTAESKQESKPEDPTADTSTGEEKAPAPDGSSSENPAPGGESEAASSSGTGPEDTGSENAGSDVNSDDSGSEAASSDSSSTDETMSEGRVTVNGEGEPFRFQRKFTVTKNGTYVIRIYDSEGPLEERSFYTEVDVTSLGELTAEIAPGSAAIRCLETGGVVMIRCWLENCPHYVLLTGIMEQGVALFDPYEDTRFYDWEQDGVLRVEDEPRRWNRIVTMDRLNAVDNQDYAMGEVCKRESLLIWNSATEKKA